MKCRIRIKYMGMRILTSLRKKFKRKRKGKLKRRRRWSIVTKLESTTTTISLSSNKNFKRPKTPLTPRPSAPLRKSNLAAIFKNLRNLSTWFLCQSSKCPFWTETQISFNRLLLILLINLKLKIGKKWSPYLCLIIMWITTFQFALFSWKHTESIRALESRVHMVQPLRSSC